jgi:GAF domain-containing protein
LEGEAGEGLELPSSSAEPADDDKKEERMLCRLQGSKDFVKVKVGATKAVLTDEDEKDVDAAAAAAALALAAAQREAASQQQ